MSKAALVRSNKKAWRRGAKRTSDPGTYHKQQDKMALYDVIPAKMSLSENYKLACSIFDRIADCSAGAAEAIISNLVDTVPNFSSATDQLMLDPRTLQSNNYSFRYRQIVERHYDHKHVCCYRNCEKPSIWSHTIPRKSLRHLAGGASKIIRIRPTANGSRLAPALEGPVKASTFRGFCSSHDSTLFSEVEDVEFAGTYRQHLLVAYRCTSRELRVKISGVRAIATIANDIALQYSKETQLFSKDELFFYTTDIANKVLFNLVSAKFVKRQLSKLEGELFDDSDKRCYSTLNIHVHGPTPIAAWGMATPEYNFDGTPFDAGPYFSDSIAFFSIHAGTEGFILAVTIDNSSPLLTRWFAGSYDIEPNTFGFILIPFVLAHVELTYFTEKSWIELDADTQAEVKGLVFSPWHRKEDLVPIKHLKMTIKSITYDL